MIPSMNPIRSRVDLHRRTQLAFMRDEIGDLEREADESEAHARRLRDRALTLRGQRCLLEAEAVTR